MSQEIIEVEKLEGTSVVKYCVNEEASSLQVVTSETKEDISDELGSIQDVTDEITVEDNVSTLGQKRKCLDDLEINEDDIQLSGVSRTLKRPRTISSSEKISHDHTYCIKSPRRLKTQVYGLVDKIENLQKKVKISKQKTRRRNRKVSTLA